MWRMALVMLAACGGASQDPIDPTARCSLVGERYDAFALGNGTACGDGDRRCARNDFCEPDGTCEVALATEEVYCALIGARYTAYADANGMRCGGGDGNCNNGDLCVEDGQCEIVMWAVLGPPHVELFGKRYDAFPVAGGAPCGQGDDAGFCMPGDRCVEPDVCELVLSGLAGTLHEELIGTRYAANPTVGGSRCDVGDFVGSCSSGDRCLGGGTCEVLFSAWSF